MGTNLLTQELGCVVVPYIHSQWNFNNTWVLPTFGYAPITHTSSFYSLTEGVGVIGIEELKLHCQHYDMTIALPNSVGHLLTVEQREWPIENQAVTNTDCIDLPLIKRLSEETQEFIKNQDFGNEIRCLETVVRNIFSDSYFELELLSGEEDDESDMLALVVYSSLSVQEFWDKRFDLYEVINDKGHKNLAKILSISQRRMQIYGWQELSCYREAIAA